jgi:hypothetical protein
MTRSPLQSFAPHAIVRMIAVGGWQYLLGPSAVGAGYLVTSSLIGIDAPDLLVRASVLYCLFVLFTFTGG